MEDEEKEENINMKKIMSIDIKYSAIQVLYYGSFCALMGYASVYLLDKGFTSSIIGIVLALVSVLSVFTQPAVGSFVDRNQKISIRKIVCLFVAVAVLFSIGLLFLGKGSFLILIFFVGVATFMMTITPLLNSMAFVFEKYGIEINFGLARGLGSAAYAIVSILLGYLVEATGAYVLPIVYIILNILMIIVTYSFVVPKNIIRQGMVETQEVEEVEEEQSQLSWIEFAKKYQKFIGLCLGLVLVYFTHTIINNFFIQVITPIGGTESQMGTAVFLAAILELPAMACFSKLREKLGVNKLIAIAVIMYIVKHAITAFAPNIIFIYVAQVFQMFSYAILTPATIYYVNTIISKSDSVKGQSLITMSYTGSGIIANLIGGFMIDSIGVSAVLLIGVGISVLGAAVVIASLEKPRYA